MSKYYSSSIAFGAKQTKTEKVVVSTTKIGDVTTDAVSGALTVDEVPTLNSLNPVSSDGVARAVIQAGAELPTRGSSDTGKVLTVANSDGDLEWDEPAEELPDMAGNDGKLLGAVDNNGTMEARWVNPPDSYPTVTGNANKVLTVNSGATGVEWANVPTEVPEVTSNDDAKVLTASYSGGQGSYSWQTAQGGASYTAGDGIDITTDEISVKVGTGLEIGSSTVQTVHNLICSESVYDSYRGVYVTNDICQLTPDLIARIKATGGLAITLEKNYSVSMNVWYLAIYSQRSNAHYMAQNYYILKRMTGNSRAGTVLTYDNSDYDSSKSNVSLATIEANYADYRLGILYDVDDYYTAFAQLSGSEPEVVATYTDTTTVQDCVNVSNPLPASSQADAGKFLAVDSSGNANWGDNPLPASSMANTGQVLMVNVMGTAGWYDIIPAYSSADAGRVLQVQNDGTLAWVTLS